MLDRNDMLELTRRMTPARMCFNRMAGSYRDEEGFDDGSFNTHFLSLKPWEKEKNLAIAKAVPYSKTNEELREYDFPAKSTASAPAPRSSTGPAPSSTSDSRQMWQLLMSLNDCELKNDAMLDTFYELVSEHYKASGDYAIYMFHGTYDVPVKAKDKEWLEGSEEVYSFLICTICPVTGDYEAGAPECGFLFPSFNNRCSDTSHIAVYDPRHAHDEFISKILCVK